MESKLQKETARTRAVEEILSSERTYINSLNVLYEIYMEPLLESYNSRKAAKTYILNENEINTLFSNLDTIRRVNMEFFYLVAEKIRDWSSTQTIGDVFVKMADFFKVYIKYCHTYDTSYELYSHKMKESVVFRQFIASTIKHPRNVQGANFLSFLIIPVQRVPRYVLLIEAVLRYTPEDHPDYPHLLEATGKIKEILNIINKNVEEEEERHKILEIQSRFISSPNIILPYRRYIYDGVLIDHKSTKRFHCYLFSDVFIIARIFAQPNALLSCNLQKIRRIIPLDACWIVDEGALSHYPSLQAEIIKSHEIIVLSHDGTCYHLVCKNLEEMKEWSKHLRDQIRKHVITKQRFKDFRSDHAVLYRSGVWKVQDKKSIIDSSGISDTSNLFNLYEHDEYSISIDTSSNQSPTSVSTTVTANDTLNMSSMLLNSTPSMNMTFSPRKNIKNSGFVDKSVKKLKPLFKSRTLITSSPSSTSTYKLLLGFEERGSVDVDDSDHSPSMMIINHLEVKVFENYFRYSPSLHSPPRIQPIPTPSIEIEEEYREFSHHISEENSEVLQFRRARRVQRKKDSTTAAGNYDDHNNDNNDDDSRCMRRRSKSLEVILRTNPPSSPSSSSPSSKLISVSPESFLESNRDTLLQLRSKPLPKPPVVNNSNNSNNNNSKRGIRVTPNTTIDYRAIYEKIKKTSINNNSLHLHSVSPESPLTIATTPNLTSTLGISRGFFDKNVENSGSRFFQEVSSILKDVETLKYHPHPRNHQLSVLHPQFSHRTSINLQCIANGNSIVRMSRTIPESKLLKRETFVSRSSHDMIQPLQFGISSSSSSVGDRLMLSPVVVEDAVVSPSSRSDDIEISDISSEIMEVPNLLSFLEPISFGDRRPPFAPMTSFELQNFVKEKNKKLNK